LGTEAVFLPIDLLWSAIHEERRNDWRLFELLTGVLFETALSFAKRGSDVVVDTVFERADCVDQCCRVYDLEARQPLFVGLFCADDELERRERERGDRPTGLASRQAARVHDFCEYNVRLRTDTMSVDQCVAAVLRALGEPQA
jgi:chloramphenicol 3-O-phosphotransferase